MAFARSDIDALEAAIATGALSVTFAGPPARSVTYRSLSEMCAVLAMMRRAVAESNGTPLPPYRVLTTRDA